jgi:hypothetical protein
LTICDVSLVDQQCSPSRRTRPRGKFLTRHCGPSPFQLAVSHRCRQRHPRTRLPFTILHKARSPSRPFLMLFGSVASSVLHKESVELPSIASSHLPRAPHVKPGCVYVCVLDLLGHFSVLSRICVTSRSPASTTFFIISSGPQRSTSNMQCACAQGIVVQGDNRGADIVQNSVKDQP